MQITAELYKTILENLIKSAAADGYDFYAEVEGDVEEGYYGGYFALGNVNLTFSNQVAFKNNGGELDYATVDDSIYSSSRA